MTTRVSRALLVTLLVTSLAASTAARQAAPARTFNPQDTIPFDAAVKTGTLPNGLKFYVRQNSRPANRVLLRLAVKTGSLDEADDQQGLAHMLEHMAFNGSEHFKPGELDLLLRVHRRAARAARQRVRPASKTRFTCSICRPTSRTSSQKGFTALADFAGGLSLDPKEIDKERGVVIEEWRGGLGAGSRIRDKQIPVLFYHSRYARAAADRQARDPPDVPARAAARLLRHLLSARSHGGRRGRRHGSADARATMVKAAFGGLKARSAAPPERKADVPLHKESLVSVVTDPEITQSSVTIVRKRPRPGEAHVGDYRRDLVQRIFEQMLNERFDELTRRPDAKFLGAGVYRRQRSARTSRRNRSARACRTARSPKGSAAVAIEAKRAREFGFGARRDRPREQVDGGVLRARLHRARQDRERLVRAGVSQSLPRGRAEPGHRLRIRARPAAAARDHRRGGHRRPARTLLGGRQPRGARDVARRKAGIAVPTEEQMRASLRSSESAAVTAWNDTTVDT